MEQQNTQSQVQEEIFKISREALDFKAPVEYKLKVDPGLSEEVVKLISAEKNEPEWMLKKRIRALEYFIKTPLPRWGPSLSQLDLSKITYYMRAEDKNYSQTWNEVPSYIKETFEKLGIPQAEAKALAGTGAQFESVMAYHNLKREWEEKGVIFEDMDAALKKYPELVQEYFMTKCIPINDHKFIMLHAAVWSGGTFIYVPPNVKVTLPLQAYFRMNAAGAGQFEHTLIVADKGSELHYIEGCSAPLYNVNNLHAGCVEIYVKEGARVRYSSIENWSKNTYNLNTKRAIVEKEGVIEWVTGNLGSRVSMVYPCSILKGENSRASHLTIAFAGKGQEQDTGAKVYHLAPNTSSIIQSKSISKEGGITTYRGLVKVNKNAWNIKSKVQCDALLLDEKSVSNTIPYIDVRNKKSDVAHEASTGKISEEQLFYLMSRGLSEKEATEIIVNGFLEPIIKELPLEYAIEFNRLIQLELEGGVG